ncbi:MAG: sulfide/dihydroorotate dehydrogenase-like FAD/NAD-binding protein [Candidatus Omnitrophota bacterium]|nr:sulfide/dihydroorotate dehydrogenase-like FAD/NAD-binding protein [Candidatus Omnitrophota bacterium]
MFEIIEKVVLAEGIKKMVIQAKKIASKAAAGQFVMVIPEENGERIPLTIADHDSQNNAITLIFQEVGYSTKKLGSLKIGQEVFSILGPLGHPTEIANFGKVVCVGGGVGIAELYPVCKALKQAGNRVIGIMGARTKRLLILESHLRRICNELYITTDDGSYGTKGFVSDVLKNILNNQKDVSLIYAIGPVPMMRAVSELTKPYKIKTIVSLNPVMVDGTGMCGACRVRVGGKTLFGCVDGPEFDGHLVDFPELQKRLSLYKEQEICIDKKCRASL